LHPEYSQITQGDRNAGTTNRAPGWPQDVCPKACTRLPEKTAKQRQQRIAWTTRRRRVNFTHQAFKPRPIQNRFGVVQAHVRKLEQETRGFLQMPRNVMINYKTGHAFLSMIFEFYPKEVDSGSGVAAFVNHYA
jgi:hypothetical protein